MKKINSVHSPRVLAPSSVLMAILSVAGLIGPLTSQSVAQIEMNVGTTESAEALVPTPTPVRTIPLPSETTGTEEVDASAHEAAAQINLPLGTVLDSTENATLGTGSVVTGPSLKVTDEQILLEEGGTSETLAVKSGADLLRVLGVERRGRAVTSAAEDFTTDTALFDVEAVKRLKGDSPTVMYRVVVDNTPLPDPMIIPWILRTKLLEDRFNKAVDMLAMNQVNEGRSALLSIVTEFPDSEYATQARAMLKKLDDLNEADVPAPIATVEATPDVVVQIDPNIKIGTVMVDPAAPEDNRAVIGTRSYKAGDEIQGVRNHKVLAISEDVVLIEVSDPETGLKKTFEVDVRPNSGR